MMKKKVLLSLLLPWLLAPAMFALVVAAVRAWITDSVITALVFVVLPLAAWIAAQRSCCKDAIQEPVFAPSFVAAVIATTCGTYVAILRPAISAGLEVAFGFAALTLILTFWRMIVSDPGQLQVTHSKLKQAQIGDPDWGTKPSSYITSSGHVTVARTIPCQTGKSLTGVRDVEISDGGCLPTSIQPQFPDRDNEGFHSNDSSIGDETLPPQRSQFCRQCNAWIDHFDHHCPAVMNCVGRKNHVLFLGMLLAFIVAEFLFVWCCYIYLAAEKLFSLPDYTIPIIGLQELDQAWHVACQVFGQEPWVASTMTFAGFQVFWQILLLAFHIYCAAINLTTNEWIKWEKYSALYIEIPPKPSRPLGGKKFVNPYDQGIIWNLLQFFRSRV
ncbi:unnamed protein product [Sphagnum balticum]